MTSYTTTGQHTRPTKMTFFPHVPPPSQLPVVFGVLLVMISGGFGAICLSQEIMRKAVPSGKAEPQSDEKLTLSEEKCVRKSVYDNDIWVSTPRNGPWANYRVLEIPKKLETVYAKKPKETICLLLKILEGGCPKDALLAAGYIGALMDSPPYGAVTVMFPLADLDNLTADGKETYRERLRLKLVKLIGEKEKRKAKDGKK